MKGKAPNRYFFHDGTKYILTGNKRLAMSHFHEVRSHLKLMKMTNVQNLPITSGTKEFDDGTVAEFQLIHGIEKIEIYAPSHVESREFTRTVQEDYEQIVPCLIVTAKEDEEEILGYVACMSGSFMGDYKWFAVPDTDGEAVFEGFLVEGDENYIEDLAFDHERLLSFGIDAEKLLYFKPSGTIPDDLRLSSVLIADNDTEKETYLGDGRWTDYDDGTTLYTASVGTTYVDGGTELILTRTFDGQDIFKRTDNTVIQDWAYSIWLGTAIGCSSSDSFCQEQVATAKASSIPVLDYTHSGINTYAFNGTRKKDLRSEYLLGGFGLGKSLRINDNDEHTDSGGNLVFLTAVNEKDELYSAWNDLGEPSGINFQFSTASCSGCYSYIYNEVNYLFVVPDAERFNVTAFFGWDTSYEYSKTYAKSDLVYQKADNADAISLSSAVVFAPGEYYQYPGTLAYIYTGPAAEEVTGSISFPVEDASKPYIDAHVAFEGIVPEDIAGRIRGDVFLGIVKIEGKEETIIEA